jgi:hypothetical protein
MQEHRELQAHLQLLPLLVLVSQPWAVVLVQVGPLLLVAQEGLVAGEVINPVLQWVPAAQPVNLARHKHLLLAAISLITVNQVERPQLILQVEQLVVVAVVVL